MNDRCSSLTVEFVETQDIVVIELQVRGGPAVVWIHDGGGASRVSEAKTVTYFVDCHAIKVGTVLEQPVSCYPLLVVVEMEVTAVRVHFVRVEGVRQNLTSSIKSIPTKN